MRSDFHCAEMLPSLDNFLSYGADVIKARDDYKLMVLDIYTHAMTNDHLGDNDRVNACKLIESYLLNLRGAVDQVCSYFLAKLQLRLTFSIVVGFYHCYSH